MKVSRATAGTRVGLRMERRGFNEAGCGFGENVDILSQFGMGLGDSFFAAAFFFIYQMVTLVVIMEVALKCLNLAFRNFQSSFKSVVNHCCCTDDELVFTNLCLAVVIISHSHSPCKTSSIRDQCGNEG